MNVWKQDRAYNATIRFVCQKLEADIVQLKFVNVTLNRSTLGTRRIVNVLNNQEIVF